MSGWSLRARLTLLAGICLVVLQAAGSTVVLLRERRLLVQERLDVTLAAARSLAGPVLDALIAGEIHPGTGGPRLAQAVGTFRGEHPRRVRYVAVVGTDGRILAHSDLRLTGRPYAGVAPGPFRPPAAAGAWIHRAGDGWVAEALVPLAVSTRRWGTLVVGFEADTVRAEIGRLLVFLGVLTAVMLLLAVAAVHWATRRATRDLLAIVSAVDALDLDTVERVALPPCGGEAGVLADRFAALQRRLLRSRGELERAAREIRQAERLAAVGRLAAGVAHAVNNPLMGVRNCVEAIADDPADEPRVQRHLALAREGLQRIGRIVRQLLEFSRQRPRQRSTVDLLACVNRMTELIAFRLEGEGTAVHVTSDTPDTTVRGDPQQLEELFLNLMINACDAMPEGGRIEIHFREPAPGWLEVTVADTGPGIPPEILDLVCDPFFTTKEVNRGTGLGLSVSDGIVRSHGGTLRPGNRPAGGAVFTIRLPRDGGGEEEA